MAKNIFLAAGCAFVFFIFGCAQNEEKKEQKAADVYRESVNNLADTVMAMDAVKCRQNLLGIADVLRTAYQMDGHYPETLVQGAGKELPIFQCPKTHQPYLYHVLNDGEGYEVMCPNPEAHKMKRLRLTQDGLDVDPPLAIPGAAP